MKPTEGQRQALHLALTTKKNLFIGGVAGTGKTFLLNKIAEGLQAKGRQVRKAAFTGIASQKIEGTTLSMLLGLRLGKRLSDLDEVNLDTAYQNLVGVTDLIVDEISMCSGDFLELVDHTMREVLEKNQPFGGVRVILSGDFLQLPPVFSMGEEKPRYRWAFQYPEFQSCQTILLTEPLRHRDPEEFQLLNEFRQGLISERGRKFLDSAVGRKLSNPAQLYGRRRDMEAVNAQYLARHPGVLHSYPTSCYPEELTKQLLDQVPIEESVDIKVGAPVILLENNHLRGYFNGSQGTVEECGYSSANVRLLGGKLVQVDLKVWEVAAPAGRSLGEVEGLPLQLGWAATIHRAQGLTLKQVRAEISGCWEPGQAYVALSRTTSLQNLSLVSPVTSIKASQEALAFLNSIEEAP